jgi:hypothetical protein
MGTNAVVASGTVPAGAQRAVQARRGGPVIGLLALGVFVLALALLPRPGSLSGGATRPDGLHAGAAKQLPLSFIPNRGQTDSRVRYYAQGSGYAFYFTPGKAVLSFQEKGRGDALHLRFVGASAGARLSPERRGGGKVSYLTGNRPAKWQAGLPTYGQLAYHGVWPGVDMRFRGDGGALKYEFRLQPGASAKRIRLAYAGAEGLSRSGGGDLLIQTPLGTLRDSRPTAWQAIRGRRVPVKSRYVLGKTAAGARGYGFQLGAYDHSRPLVIDPGLAYSTFLGGIGTDLGNAIAVDGSNSAYVTGRAASSEYPATAGAFDASANGSEDAFVTKLSPDGSALAYSTFLGGIGVEEANGIAVDGAGSAYVTGDTTSTDFPTTAGAFDETSSGDDAFVTKLSPDGSALAYSTFLGGTSSDLGEAIAVDGAGSAYVTGYTLSGNFPTTTGAFDTTNAGFYDTFVTKLDAPGATLAYSTFLGGGDSDIGGGIAVDAGGSAYVTGSTRSPGFPTTAGAFDTSHNGTDDGFVTKLNASGSALGYSTFLGGTSFDGVAGVAIDAAGAAYVTGSTSSPDFPTTAGAFDTSYNNDSDGFVTKVDTSGASLTYSTYLGGPGTGGTGYDAGYAIAVDGGGRAYVTGRTDSLLFPTTPGAYDTVYNGGGDVFLTKLDASGAAPGYSTYLGGNGADAGDGVAIDADGSAYITGYTTSSGFPTTAGAFDTTFNGGYDAYVSKLDPFPGGYPRPQAATPLFAPLVLAFKSCTAANTVHAAPLADSSCDPSVQESNYLTVGTPNANGQMSNAAGSVRFVVVNGDSGTAQNEADVRIVVGLTDVRNKSGLSDYTGELRFSPTIRMTDKYNSGDPVNGPFGDAATTSDFSFPFSVPCAATGDATIGSTCSADTTANAVLAGSVQESKRTIWQMGPIQAFDGGADGVGSTNDNTLFETQGVFAP